MYKNEPKIPSKDFPKVNDPTISEFMATFSAWIRVPDHRVLRCGSLQIKSEKKSLNLCTPGPGAGAKDSGGSPEYWPQNGAGSPEYWPQNGAKF